MVVLKEQNIGTTREKWGRERVVEDQVREVADLRFGTFLAVVRVLAAFIQREMCGWQGMTLKNHLDIQQSYLVDN